MSAPAFDIDLPETVQAVADAFDAYFLALETNDLVALDDAVWNDARLVRFGAKETAFGADSVRGFRSGRRPAARRKVSRRLISTFGTDFATINLLFEKDDEPDRTGRWSQTWVRFDGVWKIVAAHVSLIA